MRVKVVGVVAELAMTGSETRVASSALPSAAVPEQGAPTVTRGGAQASLLQGALGRKARARVSYQGEGEGEGEGEEREREKERARE